jgi:hypothetical protein
MSVGCRFAEGCNGENPLSLCLYLWPWRTRFPQLSSAVISTVDDHPLGSPSLLEVSRNQLNLRRNPAECFLCSVFYVSVVYSYKQEYYCIYIYT